MKWILTIILFVSLLSGCAMAPRDVNSELNELRERVVHLERTDAQTNKILGAIILEINKSPKTNGVPAIY